MKKYLISLVLAFALFSQIGIASFSVPAGSITNSKLSNSSVTAAKLATDAVETAKIKDANVTIGKLATSVADGATLEHAGTSMRVKDSGITTAKIADLAVTQAKIGIRAVASSVGIGGIAASDSSGSFGISSTGDTQITNQSVTIQTKGNPVKLMLVPYPYSAGHDSYISCSLGTMFFKRDGNIIVNGNCRSDDTNLKSNAPFEFVDTGVAGAAGTYTYTAAASATSGTISVNRYRLIAYEL